MKRASRQRIRAAVAAIGVAFFLTSCIGGASFQADADTAGTTDVRPAPADAGADGGGLADAALDGRDAVQDVVAETAGQDASADVAQEGEDVTLHDVALALDATSDATSDVPVHCAGPEDCDDDNPCTTDTCDPQTGCIHAGNDVTVGCNDGNDCTTNDRCQGDAAGTCAGTNAAETGCDDENLCTLADTCINGTCTGGEPVQCTPSDQCHDAGTCDPATGVCSKPAKEDGAACDDGEICTRTDICIDAACTGTEPVQNCCVTSTDCPGADSPCQSNACFQNQCRLLDIPNCCEDTNPVGEDPSCDDNNPCTVDYCFLQEDGSYLCRYYPTGGAGC